jgi:hypothetical protein
MLVKSVQVLVSSVCTQRIIYRGRERGLLTCYPDTNLEIAKEIMEARGIKQLPVIKRDRKHQRLRKQRIVAILHYDSIWNCLRFLLVSHTMTILYTALFIYIDEPVVCFQPLTIYFAICNGISTTLLVAYLFIVN